MARTAAWLMVAAWGLAAMRLLASSGETGVGDSSGDEFHVVERKSLEYRHELRVTAMTEKSEKIVNPLRWLPLEYFVPDGAEVRKGDLIARFNQTSSRHDEKSQSMELAVVEAELQRRLTAIDNRNLEMDESLGDLQDKLASLEAKLTRLLSEPNQDDIRIAEGKLKLADLNLRLAASDFRRAEGRFRRGMISRAELDSTEKTLRENEIKHEFAVCELELTLAPIALPYDIERTRLQIANARLEIEKLQSEIAEQSKLSEIQKRGASQRRKRTLNELKNTRRDIENAEMRAPIDGFISHRRIDGNELKLGMRLWNNVTFMEIPDLQTIGFQGVLLESARKHFEKGDRVVVRLQGKLTRKIECRLESISTLSHDISEKGNTSSNQNRKYGVNVFDVTIRFGAGTEGVRPGMTGIAEIIASRPLEGPAVPLKFMRYEEGRHYIIVDGILEEVTGTACGGWFVLDDAKWLGVRVGMRGEHRRAEVKTEAGEERLTASGELEPVRKTDVVVGDIGWWPWPKVMKLVPEETMVKKGDIIAELDPKEREKQIERQESSMAEMRSSLEETEKKVEITRRNGEFSTQMARNTLEIQRLTTRETLDDSRRPLSYFRAVMNRDLADIRLTDIRRRLDRERAKRRPTLSPVERKRLERDLRRQELKLEQAQLNLATEEEGVKPVRRSKARLDLLEAESTCETSLKSAVFDNASIRREYERIRQNMRHQERRLERRRHQKENHTVRAPADGLICYNKVWSDGMFKKISVGSAVGPRFTIMSIPDLSEMEVMVEVPEHYYPQLREGLPVEVRVPSLSERLLPGQVSRIDLLFTNRGKKDSQLGLYSSREPLGDVVFKVRVRFQNDGLALKPGLVSEVFFPFGK